MEDERNGRFQVPDDDELLIDNDNESRTINTHIPVFARLDSVPKSSIYEVMHYSFSFECTSHMIHHPFDCISESGL